MERSRRIKCKEGITPPPRMIHDILISKSLRHTKTKTNKSSKDNTFIVYKVSFVLKSMQ